MQMRRIKLLATSGKNPSAKPEELLMSSYNQMRPNSH